MPEDDRRQRRRRRKKWSARRWRFELTRIGILLALLLLIVLLVRGCWALTHRPGEDKTPADTVETLPEAQEQADAAPPEPQEQTISLIMVGDILLHTPLHESGLQPDGTYNYDHFFAHTKDLISSADLALVNQEVILGGTELGLSGYPAFNGAYEVGDALVKAGFDVILHATNHAVDKGEQGILNCLRFWQTNYPDIAVLGIHDSQERQDEIYIYEQDGVKIAILNYTYGTNGIAVPQPYEVDLLEEGRVISDLDRAEELADFTIVVPHWGTEYTHEVSASQERWTQVFLAHGADLVIGAHPHVIQPVEWVEDDAGHKMLVYYSLGNFINFTSDSGDGVRQRAVGAMATVTLSVENGDVAVSDYGVIPLVSHMVEGTGNPTVYPLSEYTEALAAESAMTQKDPGFTLDYCKQVCRDVFGALYQES